MPILLSKNQTGHKILNIMSLFFSHVIFGIKDNEQYTWQFFATQKIQQMSLTTIQNRMMFIIPPVLKQISTDLCAPGS